MNELLSINRGREINGMESTNTPLNKSIPIDTLIDVTPSDNSTPDNTLIDGTDSNTDEALEISNKKYLEWQYQIYIGACIVNSVLLVGYFLLFGVVIIKGFPLDSSHSYSNLQTLFLLGLVLLPMYSVFVHMLRKLFNFYKPANFNSRNISIFTKRTIPIWCITLIVALGSGLSFGSQHKPDLSNFRRYFACAYSLLCMSFMLVAVDMMGGVYSLIHIAMIKDETYEEYKSYIKYTIYASGIAIVLSFFLGCGCYGFSKKLGIFFSKIASQVDSIAKN
ncbi:hypothetical protein NEAUS04_1964 [Nematocida ausubeli]|nr:hypothetical protein NEAUS07_1909 [Nematocida ausubeli]KAI5150277.1 hypothetical protein NEAUS05_2108 [Nematocida ausubeli]KAI5164126.1 hypothetical protein NEAUS04_1964 [Nematocida ausubeli]